MSLNNCDMSRVRVQNSKHVHNNYEISCHNVICKKSCKFKIKITHKLISNRNHKSHGKRCFEIKIKEIKKVISNHDFKSIDFKPFPSLIVWYFQTTNDEIISRWQQLARHYSLVASCNAGEIKIVIDFVDTSENARNKHNSYQLLFSTSLLFISTADKTNPVLKLECRLVR